MLGPYRAPLPTPHVGWLRRLRYRMWLLGVSLVGPWRAPGDGVAALTGVLLKALGSPEERS